jgi:hypothetical protein
MRTGKFCITPLQDNLHTYSLKLEMEMLLLTCSRKKTFLNEYIMVKQNFGQTVGNQ